MPKLGHIIDSNTHVLYRFDELSGTNITDVARASDVTARGSPPIVAGLIDFCREFDGAGSQYIDKSNNAAMATMLLGAWTIEMWVYADPGAFSTIRCAISYGPPPPGSESESLNYLMRLRVMTDGRLAMLWERGAGIDVEVIQDTGATVGTGVWTHLACVKRLNGATYDVEFYINGVHQQTFTGLQNATGGGSSQLHIARNASAVAGAEDWDGKVDDTRISSVARSAAEIEESYLRGAVGCDVDDSAPAVTNVSPAAASDIATTTPLGFDVVDSADNLSLAGVTVMANFPGLKVLDVIFFQGVFGPLYTGSVVSIDNGWRFSNVTRTGGWPASPTLIVDARDDTGNG